MSLTTKTLWPAITTTINHCLNYLESAKWVLLYHSVLLKLHHLTLFQLLPQITCYHRFSLSQPLNSNMSFMQSLNLCWWSSVNSLINMDVPYIYGAHPYQFTWQSKTSSSISTNFWYLSLLWSFLILVFPNLAHTSKHTPLRQI